MSKLSHAETARIFKALSHPHRLAMFLELARCCPPDWSICESTEDLCRCVGDLGADLGVGASTVSHHVKELVNAGLIRCERKGQRINCSADPDALDTLRRVLSDLGGAPRERSTP